uniref:Uncharacterized protein n=1 Tax=Plectus sambesii TaxID=2011161 RepID=A0A914WSJ3_9BILA
MQMKEMFAGGFLFVTRSTLSARIMKWAVLCSLEPECMEPKGAVLTCSWGAEHDRWRQWAGCHRYDQSMINVIMNTWWDYNASIYTTNRFKSFAGIKRRSVGFFNLKSLCHQQ